jgi:hypothetical protein
VVSLLVRALQGVADSGDRRATRGKTRGATYPGLAIAGVVCCALALVVSIDLSVREALRGVGSPAV